MSNDTDIIEKAKLLFKDRLDPELVAEVETWDDYHQDFFWAYAYKRFQQILDARVLEEIVRGSGQVRPAGIDAVEPSPTPFKDAEMLLRPGKWFSDNKKWIR
jgi:hypothetical protein